LIFEISKRRQIDLMDNLDPVEATEIFLEDAAAAADQPDREEILWRAASKAGARLSFAEFKF